MKEEPFYPNSHNRDGEPDQEKWLDQILRTDDITPLSDSFAGRVARKAARRMILRQQMAEFLTYASAFLGALVLLLVVLYFTSRESLAAWTSWIIPVREILAGGGIVLIFILFADRVVLPWFFFVSRSGKNLPTTLISRFSSEVSAGCRRAPVPRISAC